MKSEVPLRVLLGEGLLDPEGQAIKDAINNLGFAADSLNTARLFTLGLEAPDKGAAGEMALKMCERILQTRSSTGTGSRSPDEVCGSPVRGEHL